MNEILGHICENEFLTTLMSPRAIILKKNKYKLHKVAKRCEYLVYSSKLLLSTHKNPNVKGNLLEIAPELSKYLQSGGNLI